MIFAGLNGNCFLQNADNSSESLPHDEVRTESQGSHKETAGLPRKGGMEEN
jgi:hypothetical protein